MDRKSILMIILLGIFCNGCIHYHLIFDRNYYRIPTEEAGKSGFRPILPRFRLAKPEPYRLKPEDQIDTTLIYVRRFISKVDNKEQVYFYRFFGNGRFITDVLYGDSLQYNKLKLSTIGYYRMKTYMELELENFTPENATHAKYSYSRGVVKGDTLFMYFDPPKNKPISELKKDKEFSIYLKQKVDTLIGKPDW